MLTRSHVPPRAAGNTDVVRRAPVRTGPGGAAVGRFTDGGMWVRGLCQPCNHLAGRRYDAAYADFAARVRPYVGAGRVLVVNRRDAPAVPVAPGLVSRCVLFGMHAISPNLRRIFPELAALLLADEDGLRLPPGLRLRLALTPGPTARLAGPIHARRLLGVPGHFVTFGEVFFPPLAWVLTSPETGSLLDEQGWADVTDWPQYNAQRTNVDLRHLTGRLPLVRHPLHTDPDNWMSMFSDEITPILEGRLPN